MFLKKRTDYIEIDGKKIDIVFKPDKRKTLSLQVESSDCIVLKHPLGVSAGILIDLLESKRKWLEKRIKTLEKAEKEGFGKGIYEGRSIFFKGEIYKMQFAQDPICVLEKKLLLPANTQEEQLDRWYKNKTIEMVEEFMRKHKNIPDNFTIKVKRQKTIWGSCNSKRRIYINTKLSMCSQEVVDYVIWHELTHLDQMDHSHKFYKKLEKIYPDYKKHRKWLKENATKLKI